MRPHTFTLPHEIVEETTCKGLPIFVAKLRDKLDSGVPGSWHVGYVGVPDTHIYHGLSMFSDVINPLAPYNPTQLDNVLAISTLSYFKLGEANPFWWFGWDNKDQPPVSNDEALAITHILAARLIEADQLIPTKATVAEFLTHIKFQIEPLETAITTKQLAGTTYPEHVIQSYFIPKRDKFLSMQTFLTNLHRSLPR